MSEFPTSKLSSVEREVVLVTLALEKFAAERGKWLDAVCVGD